VSYQDYHDHYDILVYQIHPHVLFDGEIRPKYRVEVKAEDWGSSEYIYCKWFATRCAKKIIKRYDKEKHWEDKVVKEYGLDRYLN
jgi:hypothetical protein